MGRNYNHFVFDVNQRYIYPTSDWGFKYLLGSEENKDLLLGILNRLLPDLHIETLEYIPREFKLKVGKLREASFDVYCRLEDGSRVVVEMQNYVKKSFVDRSLVYTSMAVLEQFYNSRIRDYSICKTIYIAFLGEPLYRNVPHTPVRIGLCDLDSEKTMPLNDKLLQFFVELPKFAGSIAEMKPDTPFVEKLAYVMMEMADCSDVPENLDDDLLEQMFKAADMQTMSEQNRNDYMRAVLGEFEYEMRLSEAREEGLAEGHAEGRAEGHAAGRAEGFAEGHAEGRAEGRAEGFAKGHAEGIAEGLAEGRESGIAEGMSMSQYAMAGKLKELGVAVDIISQSTGLSPDVIDNL